MAWSQEELDFFSQALGQPITPDMAAGTWDSLPQAPYNQDTGFDYQWLINNRNPYVDYTGGFNAPIDPATGQGVVRLTDKYHQGTTDVLDPSKLKYDPTLGIHTSSTNMKQYEKVDWGLYLTLAAMGGVAAAANGAFGAAAQQTVMGAEAAAAAQGVPAITLAESAAGAGATTYPLTSTGLAAGAAAPTGTALSAGATGAGLFGTGITGSQALSGAKLAAGVAGAMGVGGSSGKSSGFDLGNMITGGGNLAYQNSLGNQAVQEAREMAPSMQFTPYSISSGMGRTYVDPATGEMKSEMSPEWQGAQDTLMDSFYGNMQYASMDPMEASQYAYNMGSNLNAYQDEQNRLGLENRLLSQGMLGSTGGASQMRSLYDSMNQRDLGREAQSLGLGQDMLNQYQQRGIAAYQPAWNQEMQFANQINQSGQLGGQAMQGNTNAANLINQANLGRMKMNSTAATSFANNPSLSEGINNLWDAGANMVGDWWKGGYTGGEDFNKAYQNSPNYSQQDWSALVGNPQSYTDWSNTTFGMNPNTFADSGYNFDFGY